MQQQTLFKDAQHVKAKPVLKWAGGKQQMLDILTTNMPKTFNKYMEPFIGGAALFFELAPQNAVIADSNPELVNLYTVIKNDVDSLIAHLKEMRNEETFFYEVRSWDPDTLSEVERAARTVYLNRTCFNGLYRVNKKGQFNTPFGKYKNPKICDEVNLRAASAALQTCTIVRGDYKDVLQQYAEPGDFIFLDPPYMPVSQYSDFKRYTKEQFYEKDQVELAAEVKRLQELGCYILLTNSNHPRIRELYADYEVSVHETKRNINSDASKRKGEDILVKVEPGQKNLDIADSETPVGVSAEDLPLVTNPEDTDYTQINFEMLADMAVPEMEEVNEDNTEAVAEYIAELAAVEATDAPAKEVDESAAAEVPEASEDTDEPATAETTEALATETYDEMPAVIADLPKQMNRFPSTRFMGSKEKLLPYILGVASQFDYHSVLDLFSGSAVVSYLFKAAGKQVLSNDYMAFAANTTKALVENNQVKLDEQDLAIILDESTPTDHFVSETFKDIYFFDEDNAFIDMVRANVKRLPDETKRSLALAALVRACLKKRPRGIFTYTGHRYDDGRRDLALTLREQFMEAVEALNNAVFDNGQQNVSHHGDAMTTEQQADIVYMDPPYYSTQSDNEYVRRYHFVEGLVRDWQGVEMQWHTKTKKFKSYPTPFSNKKGAYDAFDQLFNKYRDSILLVSYSSNSLPTKEDMLQLMRKYKENVKVVSIDYKYSFGNQGHKVGNNKNDVAEYLFVGY